MVVGRSEMRGKKAKKLRRMVTGDPDMAGRLFARKRVVGTTPGGQEVVDPKSLRTYLLHPNSARAQYQQAKKENRWR
jgi:hypothetical protein